MNTKMNGAERKNPKRATAIPGFVSSKMAGSKSIGEEDPP
jgi:hypothetical protein